MTLFVRTFISYFKTADKQRSKGSSFLRSGGSAKSTGDNQGEDRDLFHKPDTADYNSNHHSKRFLEAYEKFFEGDIIPDYNMIITNYGKDVADELIAEGILKAPNEYAQQSIVTDMRWDTRVNDIVIVPYTVNQNYSSKQKNNIKKALEELGARSKVIQFVPRNGQSDYIKVGKDSGCSSYVGMQGGEQFISLASYCVSSKGIIQHEFMHAIGLFHEQSRTDRDNFVTINWNNVSGGRDNHNFEKKTETKTLGGAYDYGSVMHYGQDSFSKNGKDTITPKKPTNGKIIGQRTEADNQDLLDIRLLYQCKSGARTMKEYNANRCTTDCKCWENEVGCKGNNNACQGSMVCQNNKCVGNGEGGGGVGGGGGGGPRPTPSPTRKQVGKCMDSPMGWSDIDNFNCAWYASKDPSKESRCDLYGDDYAKPGGKTANQACCACGGGNNGGDGRIGGSGGDLGNKKVGYIMIDNKCMSMDKNSNNAAVWECYNGRNQEWMYNENTRQLKNMRDNGRKCLHRTKNDNVIVKRCDVVNTNQMWFADATGTGGTFKIRSKSITGKWCLKMDRSSKDNLMVETDCSNTVNKVFTFKPVG